MLAQRQAPKYPYFDLLEIVADFDLHRKNFKPLRPVRSGNIVPGFNLNRDSNRWQHFFNGAETHGPILLRQLLSKPLTLFFYSVHWKDHGIDLLKTLNALQYEIKANGGNLLIISAEKTEELEKIVWDNSLSLNFYHDPNNEIARQFRIFSEEDPAWNKFSGVDANVPLPATYVLSANGQVLFAHTDVDPDNAYPVREVLAAVYQAALPEKPRVYLSA